MVYFRNYKKLLKHVDCKPEHFLMIGNSKKSDILPVLALGGYGGHIPFQVTWTYEQHEQQLKHTNFVELKSIDSILNYLLP